PAWEAGAKETPIVLHQLNVTSANGEVFPASGPYREGERVTLFPKDILGYTFDHWSGDVSGSEKYVQVTMDSSINVTANFTPIPTYQLNIDHTHGILKQRPGGNEFNQGTEVTITVSPDSNIYKFTGWTGYVTDTSETISVVMNTNVDLTANFELKEIYTLTPTATNGSIRLNPEGGEYLEGTTVNVFAIPDTGYAFSHWTGDTSLVSDVSRQDIVMDHDMSITAHFEPTGIEGLTKNNDVEIYPNPNDGSQLTVNAESVDGNMQVSIYNIMGIQLFSEKYTRNNITIPLSKLDTHDGCYIIEISTKNGIIRERLIIQ
ncbi:MAG: InlB B-repeat-containing protein, partial [bacterium]